MTLILSIFFRFMVWVLSIAMLALVLIVFGVAAIPLIIIGGALMIGIRGGI